MTEIIPNKHDDLRDLIRACAEFPDSRNWEKFIARFDRAIGLAVIRVARRYGCSSPDIIADISQETYLKLCDGAFTQLRQFVEKHPVGAESYVKTIASNVAIDYFRSGRRAKRGSGLVFQACDDHNLNTFEENFGSAETLDRNVLLAEIQRYLDLCTDGPLQERDQLLFWLYFRTGLSCAAIASIPSMGLTVKGVESAILRLTRGIRKMIHENRGMKFPKKKKESALQKRMEKKMPVSAIRPTSIE